MVIVKSAQSHGSQENNFTLRFFFVSRQQQKKNKKDNRTTEVTLLPLLLTLSRFCLVEFYLYYQYVVIG